MVSLWGYTLLFLGMQCRYFQSWCLHLTATSWRNSWTSNKYSCRLLLIEGRETTHSYELICCFGFSQASARSGLLWSHKDWSRDLCHDRMPAAMNFLPQRSIQPLRSPRFGWLWHLVFQECLSPLWESEEDLYELFADWRLRFPVPWNQPIHYRSVILLIRMRVLKAYLAERFP